MNYVITRFNYSLSCTKSIFLFLTANYFIDTKTSFYQCIVKLLYYYTNKNQSKKSFKYPIR